MKSRLKQRKPTMSELVARLVQKCGLPPCCETKAVLNRKQLAELLLYIDKITAAGGAQTNAQTES